MKYKVFIDGGAGTTGLKIRERLAQRDDIEIINIQEEKRKDREERLAKIKEADVTFLCLPDSAAKEIAQYAPANSRILDTSTAHRIDSDWIYGMAELTEDMRSRIKTATRIAVPGCHASGFIFIVAPLIATGILSPRYPIAATSVTGYSGGGKAMITRHEDLTRPEFLSGAGQYGLTQAHKHLPEMKVMTGLERTPSFLPIVIDHYSGMVVTVPLQGDLLERKMSLEDLQVMYHEYYKGEPLVHVRDYCPADNFIHSNSRSGMDDIEIFIYGNNDRPVISTRFDNLGKGASGAAIQNMNIMLGIEETTGLKGDFA